MKLFTVSKKSFAKTKQRGQGMSEYIIIVALVAVGGIGVFTAFGTVIRQQVAGMANELAGKDGKADIRLAKGAADAATTKAAVVTNMGTYGAQNVAAPAAGN